MISLTNLRTCKKHRKNLIWDNENSKCGELNNIPIQKQNEKSYLQTLKKLMPKTRISNSIPQVINHLTPKLPQRSSNSAPSNIQNIANTAHATNTIPFFLLTENINLSHNKALQQTGAYHLILDSIRSYIRFPKLFLA